LFTLFTQSVKNGPSFLETVSNEVTAFKRAMHHAKTHGQVFVQAGDGKHKFRLTVDYEGKA